MDAEAVEGRRMMAEARRACSELEAEMEAGMAAAMEAERERGRAVRVDLEERLAVAETELRRVAARAAARPSRPRALTLGAGQTQRR